jgi:CNT family concentrative nucleoside transporter
VNIENLKGIKMILQSLSGLFVFAFIAWLISENRRRVSVKLVLAGLLVQLSLGAILLRFSLFRNLFYSFNKIVLFLQEATTAGTSLVFGYLGGAALPFAETYPGTSFILAFQSLPIVLTISALSALLFYWNVLPRVVKAFSWVFQKSMKIGGAEGLGISANIFVGMVESPLLIRPYLKSMTRSEIFTLMTCGMATIAGTVMVLYAGILSRIVPDTLGHILTASIISAPAAITISKIMIPETNKPTSGDLIAPPKHIGSMDAITEGTMQGIQLLINIIAMIIVLVALVHLVNKIIGAIPNMGGQPVTLQKLLGYIMSPIVWFMGIPRQETFIAGSLMGTKTILNELIAFIEMSRLAESQLSPRSIIIMTYAMCGFANPGSLGIMIGGMGAMAPERKNEIVSLGLRSIIAGTLATCMTGSVVGIFLG